MNKDLASTCSYIEGLAKKLSQRADEHDIYPHLENVTGGRIPNAIKWLLNAQVIDHDVFGPWVFSNFSELRSEYQSLESSSTEESTFFSSLRASEDFDLPEDCVLQYDDIETFEGRYCIGDKITNLKPYIPVATASHATLLLNTHSKDSAELLGCHYGAWFYVYAPSVEAHLQDLVEGLSAGRYPLKEGIIGIGGTWLERMSSKEHNLPFDFDGVLQR